ncbi:MAG: HD-GYP domain-containing protein [Clostridium sp.]|nr:HD-GYP domain-containing protein [Clostridium sp.]
MRLEFIDNVREEEILGRNIYTNEGGILLRSGIKLTDTYIKNLKKIGVQYLYIEDSRLNDIDYIDEEFVRLKRNTLKNISKIFKSVCTQNKADTSKSIDIMNELIEYVIEKKDIGSTVLDIKTYDNGTYLHCINTGIFSVFLASNLNFNRNNLMEIGIGSILHDVGKLKIPHSIICKKGALTEDEYNEVKKHPIYGEELLRENYLISDNAIKSVIEHHEKFNGSGYPYGLKGNSISKFGKVVSICDVFDAISTDRSYREKFSPSDAYELILSESGAAFDEKIVNVFKNTFSVYPLGCCVKLSNGIEAYVIRQNKGFPDKPIVRVLYDSKTKEPIDFYEIDLIKRLDIAIVDVV